MLLPRLRRSCDHRNGDGKGVQHDQASTRGVRSFSFVREVRTRGAMRRGLQRLHRRDVASTANLLKANGWRAGAPFGEGTTNFEVMREWNRAVVYRKTMVLFAERLTGS